jgi:hypothetical protein
MSDYLFALSLTTDRRMEAWKDRNLSIFFENSLNLVVGLPGDFGSFCQPDSTESENSDYVLRDKKACVRCAELSIGLESQ